MKKILLSVSLVALCLCLVGCSNTQKDLSAKLDAHLNRLSATISSVQDIKNSEITYQAAINQAPSSTRLNNPVVRENPDYDNTIAFIDSSNKIDSTIYQDVLCTNDNLGSCKSQICELIEMLRSLSAKIKKGEIKLNDNQIIGVNELLSNLAVNTNRISMSKNETNTEVGKAKAMLNDKNKNQAALNSRFIRLNNCLETRLTYYKNCLNVLNQIRILLACENGNCTYENGKVCIDGKCYDDTELSKYGENTNKQQEQNENKQFLLNESDYKLFEEFKNYLERTKKETELQSQELTKSEEKIENDMQKQYDTLEIKDISKSKPVHDDAMKDTKDINSDPNNTFDTKDIKNGQIENQNTNRDNDEIAPKQTEQQTKDIIVYDSQTNHSNRRGNVDTFRDPTVRPNIDSFRRVNGKIVSPNQLFMEWVMHKPFPDKITETNIIILSNEDPDKQFVENTNTNNNSFECC